MRLASAFALLLFATAGAIGQTALHPSVAYPFSHPPQSAPKLFAGQDGFFIDVPENAFRLAIRMRAMDNSPDVDLHIRHGQDVALTNRVQADVSLTETAKDREVVLTRSTTPPLRAGRWFIATAVDSGFANAAGLVEAVYVVSQTIAGSPIEVPAFRSLWMAGQPAGVALGNDQSTINAPVLVPSPITAGSIFQITSTGSTSLQGTDARYSNVPPEGLDIRQGTSLSQLGPFNSRFSVAGVVAPWGGLVGIFLAGEIRPETPQRIDYSGGVISLARIEPLLQQAFYIGNGYTPEGELRSFVAPTGATRLYLAVGDFGGSSSDNSGSLTAVVSIVGENRPAITTAGLTNAAGFSTRPLAAGSILSIFGENFGALAGAETVPLPHELSNTSVWFDTTPAPLYFVSPGQINAQIPWKFAMAREVLVTVVRDGRTAVPVKLPLEPFRPGIFAAGNDPIVINNRTGALVTPADPARPGDALILFANGLGPVAPPVAPGVASPSAPLAVGTFTPEVLLQRNGSEVAVRPFFSGLAPNFAGVFQVNFIVPESAPRGQVTLALQAPGFARSSPVGVTIQ